MRRIIIALASAAAIAGGAGQASASHIVVAGPVGTPAGPGTNRVDFVHVEKESTFCCSGGPSYDMGDGGFVALNEVSINQDTPPGTYTGFGCNASYECFEVPYTVSHVGEGPLPAGTAYNTVITFSYTYPAAGAYTVTWSDCCAGSPSIAQSVPYEVRDALGEAWWAISDVLYEVQPELDNAWYDAVAPAVEGAQEHSPVGISGGTARVVAL